MQSAANNPEARPFFEAAAWQPVGAGWQRVFGSFKGVGYSIEWHDFDCKEKLDWGASFHPDCVELCLNLTGAGYVSAPQGRMDFAATTAGFYRRQSEPVEAFRLPGERHQFLTVEYSTPFLAEHLKGTEASLHPVIRAAVEGKPSGEFKPRVEKLTIDQQQIISSLRQPPIYAAAQRVWYQSKALELAVAFFYQPPESEEFFCTRQQRLSQERVEQVLFLLKQNLVSPPTLEELGKKVGCSPFHLSRLFSTHTGQTITQSLRRLRMEKAADLLKSKEYNVTEVAMEVGYNSLSHFSQAFHETYGCCPGLYPMPTPAQRVLGKTRQRTK